MFQRLKEALALSASVWVAILKVAGRRLDGGGASEFCATGRASGGADAGGPGFRAIARHSKPAQDYMDGLFSGSQWGLHFLKVTP